MLFRSNVPLVLATVNSNVGTYGGATQIPAITVNAKGLVTAVSNVAISTSFTVAGNTGSGTQNNGGTLTLQGANGSGINTTVSGSGGNETITFNTDNTILRSNTSGGTQTIGSDLQISGNLTVSGATTYVNTAIVQTSESMIHLASNNIVGDVLDIGFVGQYNNGANVATGLVRDEIGRAHV